MMTELGAFSRNNLLEFARRFKPDENNILSKLKEVEKEDLGIQAV